MDTQHNNDHHQGDFFPDYHHGDSALQINEGVNVLPSVNPFFVPRKRKRLLSIDEYMEGILKGDRVVLSQAITLVESSLPEHRDMAHELIVRCLREGRGDSSMRIGITGVPGAGKSTFIENFGSLVTSKGHKLAVLAIDPSSQKTGGSILGDKTRMETLCKDPNAFIRPSPSAGSLGGVARKTRESILICETAGYDYILVETVGVGQSETAVHSMTDFFLLVLITGAGDGLQGIKRGIMEMSDLIAVNKADGNNVEKAKVSSGLYKSALQLFPPTPSGWQPTSLTCSSIERIGLEDIYAKINEYFDLVRGNGYYSQRRHEQSMYWMYESINNAIKDSFYENDAISVLLPEYEKAVLDGTIDSFSAAAELLDRYASAR
ncbi:MAG: methylmalonyl Co-A mutase-associated GTPase MeaB [Bacteroidales bacterium]|mgnify:FL=1|nr:methylmalonyl Co-A mutase-associated GTPase MeaB [Bacteroidales bacterium]